MTSPAVGEVFTVPFPFVRTTIDLGEGPGQTWQPGTDSVFVYPDDSEAVADGVGVMELTFVSIHKPGKYPARVFYTRRFQTPDGAWFGKTKLRMTTVPAFLRLTAGYHYPYEMRRAL